MNVRSIKNVLVVGSGSIAKRHIKNLRDRFPDASILCVSASGRTVDITEVGSSEVLPDIYSAVRRHLDFAIVASPAPYHLQNADELLKADVPVLIEKPLCSSLEELKSCDLRRYSANIGVAYNLRFMPAAKVVKALLDDGTVGKINTAFAEVGQYLPDWRPGSDYRVGVSARKNLGGGALLELSHELDYLNWFFGPFSKVLGVVRSTGQLDIDVEDNVDALLQQQEGLMVHLHLDFLQCQPCRQFKAIGDRGTIIWDLIANEVMIFSPDGRSQLVYKDPFFDRNQMYIDQMMAFIDSIYGEAEFESSLESALSVMGLVESIRDSSERSIWSDIGEVA